MHKKQTLNSTKFSVSLLKNKYDIMLYKQLNL